MNLSEILDILSNNKQLFKYLDFEGAELMLKNMNIQFTSVFNLNDPFDCYEHFMEYNFELDSHWSYGGKGYSTIVNSALEQRKKTYVCSFSTLFDHPLMWGYYNRHKGVCIGLDTKKLLRSLHETDINVYMLKVEYISNFEDISLIDKSAGFETDPTFFHRWYGVKSDVWQHENEIRLIYRIFDTKTPPVYLHSQISNLSFISLYLGVYMEQEKKESIIKLAQVINPSIQIFDMSLRRDSFTFDTIPVKY